MRCGCVSECMTLQFTVYCQHLKLSFNIYSLFSLLLLFLISSIFIDDTKIALHLKDNGGKILALLQCKVCLWTIRHHSDLTFLMINSHFSCLCPNKVILVCVTGLSGSVCIYVAASTTFLTKYLFHAAVFCASSFPVQQQIFVSCLFLLFLYSLLITHSLSSVLFIYILSFVFLPLNSQNSVSKIQLMCFRFGASSIFLYQSETAVRASTFHQ